MIEEAESLSPNPNVLFHCIVGDSVDVIEGTLTMGAGTCVMDGRKKELEEKMENETVKSRVTVSRTAIGAE
jgi:hypothetical protein